MINNLKESKLKTATYPSRLEMGKAAALDAANEIKRQLLKNEEINMIFAAAPSQNEFLENLLQQNVDWSKINAFHMDEYVGLAEDAPQRFGNFLKAKLFSKVDFKSVNYLNGNADPTEECERYAALLRKNPIHIVCMGIGENAHIAFNDPHVADFNDSKLVKVVDLDIACRQQQVNDGCFTGIDKVPEYALTLTIPVLCAAETIFCVVPGKNKAEAVYRTLNDDMTEACPSTVLRQHPSATLYIDKDSAEKL